jgi:hypothetical protein
MYDEIGPGCDSTVHKFIIVAVNRNQIESELGIHIEHGMMQNGNALEEGINSLPARSSAEMRYRFFVLKPDLVRHCKFESSSLQCVDYPTIGALFTEKLKKNICINANPHPL